jgi:Flp pilus assembly protein TadG
MKRFIKNERGNILVISAGAIVAVMLCASLAIDVGGMLAAKNQLQAAVDAAALAGASGLIISYEEATNRAILFAGNNNCIRQPVQLSPGDVTFPTPARIRVQATHPFNMFFARVIGFNVANITATAMAELSTLTGTNGARPWALPDLGWPTGTPVTIKAGYLGAPATNAGFFYPVDFPPINRGDPLTGAQVYQDNIIYGSQYDVFIGDYLMVEPGNMIGPTHQGVVDLINQDPGAYWDASLNMVQGSAFPDGRSPRIIKIPLYDPDFPPDSGKNTVEVIGLAAFFLEGWQGQNVIGVFMYMFTNGTSGDGYSFLMGAKLIL